MNFEKIAEQIISLSGGKKNFVSVINCMTRVRITYKEENIVEKEKIQEIPGVLGVKEAETFQIIVGPGKCTKLREELNKQLGLSDEADENRNTPKEDKVGFLKTLANIFVPTLPAIIASGILQGINNILVNMASVEAVSRGIEATDTLTATQVMLQNWHLLEASTILGILGNASFGFLAIYVGITSARQFKTDHFLGGVVGAMTLSPALSVIGLTAGQGGLFGVILGVWILAKFEKLIKNIVPDILSVILTPTLSLLSTAFVFFIAVMPITGLLSDWLIDGLMFLIDNTGIFGGFVLSALFPTLISTGLHHGLSAIHMELINSTGTTALFPVQIMSNAGLVGAGLALLVMTKKAETKEIAKGVLPTTFLAVGEPTMYGLVIPSGFGFITASLGAGFGGIMIRLLDVQASAIGASGMSAIPLIADGKYIEYLISYAVGLIAAFVLTILVGKARRYE